MNFDELSSLSKQNGRMELHGEVIEIIIRYRKQFPAIMVGEPIVQRMCNEIVFLEKK